MDILLDFMTPWLDLLARSPRAEVFLVFLLCLLLPVAGLALIFLHDRLPGHHF